MEKYEQVVITNIENTYSSGYVIINNPSKTKPEMVKLISFEINLLEKVFKENKVYELKGFDASSDLFLEEDLNRKYYFSQNGRRYNFIDGLLFAHLNKKIVFLKK